MAEQLLWSIGAADGRSLDLIDNYKEPHMLDDVVWRVSSGDQKIVQQWPSYHPSEADPEAGYRLHPRAIVFDLDHEPTGTYRLCIHYLVIAPRLPYLEIDLNGVVGRAYLRPMPS